MLHLGDSFRILLQQIQVKPEIFADFFQNPEITKYQRLPIFNRRQTVQSFQHHFRTNSIGIPHGQGQNWKILFGLKLIHQKTLCFRSSHA